MVLKLNKVNSLTELNNKASMYTNYIYTLNITNDTNCFINDRRWRDGTHLGFLRPDQRAYSFITNLFNLVVNTNPIRVYQNGGSIILLCPVNRYLVSSIPACSADPAPFTSFLKFNGCPAWLRSDTGSTRCFYFHTCQGQLNSGSGFH